MIEIWQPRWKDKTVLLATFKVTDGNNDIIFTKAKALEGKIYYANGEDIRNCPIESNGKISCYAVPMSMLKCRNDDNFIEEANHDAG